MSPRILNIYTDGVAREVNKRMLGRGLSLKNADGREWTMNQQLFVYDRTDG